MSKPHPSLASAYAQMIHFVSWPDFKRFIDDIIFVFAGVFPRRIFEYSSFVQGFKNELLKLQLEGKRSFSVK